MSSFPNTSFHLKNEQYRLSLLENEEDTIGGGNNTILTSEVPSKVDGVYREKVSQHYRRQDIFAPIWKPKIPSPPSRPPNEPRRPFRSLCHFIVSALLTLIFYTCLPVVTVLYIGFGFIPRLIVKLVFRWSDNGKFELLPATRTCSSASGNNNAIILVGRGDCDIEKIRAYMYDVISTKDEITGVGKYTHLQKRVATKFGYLCFENRESSFDIKNHVKHFNIRNKHIAVDADEIMAYLQSSYDDPFDNHLTNPQWEILLVPNYTLRKSENESYPKSGEKKNFYALIIRFHNGIMDWNMLQELLVEFLGKSSGRVRSIFCPNAKYTDFKKLIKIMAACPLVGPQAFLRKVFNSWKPFADMAPFSEQHTKISFAATKPISAEAIEDIADRTQTGLASVLATSSRIAVRNLVLGQNMEFPDSITVTRAFNTMSSLLPGVDSFITSFQKYRNALERLHTSFHSVEKSDVYLRGEQAFNKMMILLAGTFPRNLSVWMYKTLMQADVEVEICPGTDEPCKVFGGDMLEDFYGWSGVAGIDASECTSL